MSSPSHSSDMAGSSGGKGDKRVTRWEPGVDFGKLVSLFSSNKKDTRPPVPPMNQPSLTSSRPQQITNQGFGTSQFPAANNGRVVRPGAGTPDGRGPVRQAGALAEGSTPGGREVAGNAPEKKGRHLPGASLGDERSLRKDVGAGPPSPLARNPSCPPDGPPGYSNGNIKNNTTTPKQTAGLAITSGKGKGIMTSNVATNNTNSRMDRRLAGQDPRDPDTLPIRDNKDAWVPVPEIRVSEPQTPSPRILRGRDQRPAVQQGGRGAQAVQAGRITNQGRQVGGDGDGHGRGRPEQAGLGISGDKSSAPSQLSSYVPFEGGKRVPDRSDPGPPKLVIAKEYTTSPETLDAAGYKLDARTHQPAPAPPGPVRVQEIQTHQKGWKPLQSDRRQGPGSPQDTVQLRAGPQGQSKGKAKQEVQQGQLGNHQGRQGPGHPLDERHRSGLVTDQRGPRQLEHPAFGSRFVVTPQGQQIIPEEPTDSKAREVSLRPSNTQEVRRQDRLKTHGRRIYAFSLFPDTDFSSFKEQTTSKDQQRQAIPIFEVSSPPRGSSHNVGNSPSGVPTKQTQLNGQPIRTVAGLQEVTANRSTPAKNGGPMDAVRPANAPRPVAEEPLSRSQQVQGSRAVAREVGPQRLAVMLDRNGAPASSPAPSNSKPQVGATDLFQRDNSQMKGLSDQYSGPASPSDVIRDGRGAPHPSPLGYGVPVQSRSTNLIGIEKIIPPSSLARGEANPPSPLRLGRQTQRLESPLDEGKVYQAFKVPIVAGLRASGQNVPDSSKMPEAPDASNKTQNGAQGRGMIGEAEQHKAHLGHASVPQRRGPQVEANQEGATAQRARILPKITKIQVVPSQKDPGSEVPRDILPTADRLEPSDPSKSLSSEPQRPEKTFAERIAQGLSSRFHPDVLSGKIQDEREAPRGAPSMPLRIDTEPRGQVPSLLTPGSQPLRARKDPGVEGVGARSSSSRLGPGSEAELRCAAATHPSASLAVDHEEQPPRRRGVPEEKKATAAVPHLAALERIVEGGSWKDARTRPSNAQHEAPKSLGTDDSQMLGNDQRARYEPTPAKNPGEGPASLEPVELGRAEIPSAPVAQGRGDRTELHWEDCDPRQVAVTEMITSAAKTRSLGGVNAAPIKPLEQPNATRNQPSPSPMTLFPQHQQYQQVDHFAPTQTTVGLARLATNGEAYLGGPGATASVASVKGVAIRSPPQPQQPVLSSTASAPICEGSYSGSYTSDPADGRLNLAARKSVKADIVQVPWSQRYGQRGSQERVDPVPAMPSIFQPGNDTRDVSLHASSQAQGAIDADSISRKPGNLKLDVPSNPTVGARPTDNTGKPRSIAETVAPVSQTPVTPVASHKRGFWDLYMDSTSRDKHPEGSSEFVRVSPYENELERTDASAPPPASRSKEYATSGEQQQLRSLQNFLAPVRSAELSLDANGVPDCLLVPSPTSGPTPLGQKPTVPPQERLPPTPLYDERARMQYQKLDPPSMTSTSDQLPSRAGNGRTGHWAETYRFPAPPVQAQTVDIPSSIKADQSSVSGDPTQHPAAATSASPLPDNSEDIPVNHVAAPEAGAVPGPTVAARPRDAKARRKSNRLASMYGAQIKLGQDIPMPPSLPAEALAGEASTDAAPYREFGAVSCTPRSHLPDAPRSVDSRGLSGLSYPPIVGDGEAVLATRSKAGELSHSDLSGPSEKSLDTAGHADALVKGQLTRLPAQDHTSIDRTVEHPPAPKSTKLGDDSNLPFAGSTDVLPILGLSEVGPVRESQVPAPLSFQTNGQNDEARLSGVRSMSDTPAASIPASTAPALTSSQGQELVDDRPKQVGLDRAKIMSLHASAELAAMWLGHDNSGENEDHRDNEKPTEVDVETTTGVSRSLSRPYESAHRQRVKTEETGEATLATSLHSDGYKTQTPWAKPQPSGDDLRRETIPEVDCAGENVETFEPRDESFESSSRPSHGRADATEDNDRRPKKAVEPSANDIVDKMSPPQDPKASDLTAGNETEHHFAESVVSGSRSLYDKDGTTPFFATNEYNSATPALEREEDSRSPLHDDLTTRSKLFSTSVTGSRPDTSMTTISSDSCNGDATPNVPADDVISPQQPAASNFCLYDSSSRAMETPDLVQVNGDNSARSEVATGTGQVPPAAVRSLLARDEIDDLSNGPIQPPTQFPAGPEDLSETRHAGISHRPGTVDSTSQRLSQGTNLTLSSVVTSQSAADEADLHQLTSDNRQTYEAPLLPSMEEDSMAHELGRVDSPDPITEAQPDRIVAAKDERNVKSWLQGVSSHEQSEPPSNRDPDDSQGYASNAGSDQPISSEVFTFDSARHEDVESPASDISSVGRSVDVSELGPGEICPRTSELQEPSEATLPENPDDGSTNEKAEPCNHRSCLVDNTAVSLPQDKGSSRTSVVVDRDEADYQKSPVPLSPVNSLDHVQDPAIVELPVSSMAGAATYETDPQPVTTPMQEAGPYKDEPKDNSGGDLTADGENVSNDHEDKHNNDVDGEEKSPADGIESMPASHCDAAQGQGDAALSPLWQTGHGIRSDDDEALEESWGSSSRDLASSPEPLEEEAGHLDFTPMELEESTTPENNVLSPDARVHTPAESRAAPEELESGPGAEVHPHDESCSIREDPMSENEDHIELGPIDQCSGEDAPDQDNDENFGSPQGELTPVAASDPDDDQWRGKADYWADDREMDVDGQEKEGVLEDREESEVGEDIKSGDDAEERTGSTQGSEVPPESSQDWPEDEDLVQGPEDDLRDHDFELDTGHGTKSDEDSGGFEPDLFDDGRSAGTSDLGNGQDYDERLPGMEDQVQSDYTPSCAGEEPEPRGLSPDFAAEADLEEFGPGPEEPCEPQDLDRLSEFKEDDRGLDLEEVGGDEFAPGPGTEQPLVDDLDGLDLNEAGDWQLDHEESDLEYDEDTGLEGPAQDGEEVLSEHGSFTEDAERELTGFEDDAEEDADLSDAEEVDHDCQEDFLDNYDTDDDAEAEDQGSNFGDEGLEDIAAGATNGGGDDGTVLGDRELDMEDIYEGDAASVPASPIEVDDDIHTLDETSQDDQMTGLDNTSPVRLSLVYSQTPTLSPLASPSLDALAGAATTETHAEDETDSPPRPPVRVSCIYRQSIDWGQALESPILEHLAAVAPADVSEPSSTSPILEQVPESAEPASHMYPRTLSKMPEQTAPVITSPLSPRPPATPPPDSPELRNSRTYPLSARDQPTPPPESEEPQARERCGSGGPRTFDEMNLVTRPGSPQNEDYDEEPLRISSIDLRTLDAHRRTLSRRFSGWWTGAASAGPSRNRTPPPPLPYDSQYGEGSGVPF